MLGNVSLINLTRQQAEPCGKAKHFLICHAYVRNEKKKNTLICLLYIKQNRSRQQLSIEKYCFTINV